MAEADAHQWEFRARFRRHAFGWKSQPAIKRIKEAVSEIKRVARKDKVLAAEGAVLFLEKVSPALEHVDGSSGAIGTAVGNAVTALVARRRPPMRRLETGGWSGCSRPTPKTGSRTPRDSPSTGASSAPRPTWPRGGPMSSSAFQERARASGPPASERQRQHVRAVSGALSLLYAYRVALTGIHTCRACRKSEKFLTIQ